MPIEVVPPPYRNRDVLRMHRHARERVNRHFFENEMVGARFMEQYWFEPATYVFQNHTWHMPFPRIPQMGAFWDKEQRSPMTHLEARAQGEVGQAYQDLVLAPRNSTNPADKFDYATRVAPAWMEADSITRLATAAGQKIAQRAPISAEEKAAYDLYTAGVEAYHERALAQEWEWYTDGVRAINLDRLRSNLTVGNVAKQGARALGEYYVHHKLRTFVAGAIDLGFFGGVPVASTINTIMGVAGPPLRWGRYRVPKILGDLHVFAPFEQLNAQNQPVVYPWRKINPRNSEARYRKAAAEFWRVMHRRPLQMWNGDTGQWEYRPFDYRPKDRARMDTLLEALYLHQPKHELIAGPYGQVAIEFVKSAALVVPDRMREADAAMRMPQGR